MSKREFELNEQALTELRLAYDNTEDPKAQRRLQAVRLYGQGRPMDDIAEIVGCDKRSVLRWCARYQAEGVTGLESKWRGGNNAKLTSEQRQEVKEKLHQYRPDQILSPEVRISQGTYWTISDLQLAVHQWYEVSWQSETSYRTLMHDCGFSLQRAEKVYRQRPDERTIADFEAELEKK
jgi:transposase